MLYYKIFGTFCNLIFLAALFTESNAFALLKSIWSKQNCIFYQSGTIPYRVLVNLLCNHREVKYFTIRLHLFYTFFLVNSLIILYFVSVFVGGLTTVVLYPSLSTEKLQQLTSLGTKLQQLTGLGTKLQQLTALGTKLQQLTAL